MSSGKVLVYGGKGALGSVVLDYFKNNGYWVLNVDLTENSSANGNVVLDVNDDWTTQETKAATQVEKLLAGDKLDAIFCVAGGWAGGSASIKDFIKNADLMWKQSVWSSAISARLAALHLKEGGLLQLTGAAAALDGTSGMIGYGLAKAAVHQLVQSLGQEKSGLPDNATVFAILPVTLDTPMNRKWMPKADHSTWTPLTFIAENFHKWLKEQGSRPKTGSLLKFVTKDGETSVTAA
ncbi:unnamed protein product [Bursaphelenchus okinawaensis]|uniref:Dihydropteridine reductase n=1 Tax=Bursaphelenchus okinawaensis TaxID=465554 RepID=A0A811K9T8_9BILA|nr:unnamed protein product [Bursaphelenchus okinawaensis]CAG9095396.1 unnamed protein product [Bursaphelenchus okinawaensis]